jgi:hypothetical protein
MRKMDNLKKSIIDYAGKAWQGHMMQLRGQKIM